MTLHDFRTVSLHDTSWLHVSRNDLAALAISRRWLARWHHDWRMTWGKRCLQFPGRNRMWELEVTKAVESRAPESLHFVCRYALKMLWRTLLHAEISLPCGLLVRHIVFALAEVAIIMNTFVANIAPGQGFFMPCLTHQCDSPWMFWSLTRSDSVAPTPSKQCSSGSTSLASASQQLTAWRLWLRFCLSF